MMTHDPNEHHSLNHREDEPPPGLVPTAPGQVERRGRGRPTRAESLARKIRREQEEESRRRTRVATRQAQIVKRTDLFHRTYVRWVTGLSAEEATSILRNGTLAGGSLAGKKSLFLELYRQVWPDKVKALEACACSLNWLKDNLRRDPEFASEVLAIELRRLDTLKAHSYEQAFIPQNVNERLFWLKTIGRDEFGDDPLINIVNNVVQAGDDFTRLETLLKRKKQLEEQKERLLRDSRPPEPAQSDRLGLGAEQSQS